MPCHPYTLYCHPYTLYCHPYTQYTHIGPTRATSIVACIPAFVDDSGMSVSAGGSVNRGAHLGADGHLDADKIDLEALEAQSKALDEFEVKHQLLALPLLASPMPL